MDLVFLKRRNINAKNWPEMITQIFFVKIANKLALTHHQKVTKYPSSEISSTTHSAKVTLQMLMNSPLQIGYSIVMISNVRSKNLGKKHLFYSELLTEMFTCENF